MLTKKHLVNRLNVINEVIDTIIDDATKSNSSIIHLDALYILKEDTEQAIEEIQNT